MQFKFFKFALIATSLQALSASAETPKVLTAERIYNTLVDYSPYMIQKTTTIIWTQTQSSTASQAPVTPTPSKVAA
ncbi:hypothetical protein CPB84DRAFT_1792725 [Gymnopilus junonius]|uniref:Uncharacterized protein n=1 Tax=Gymnopilus junonius TaxID=109634 RepID=A0A9P5TH47_GYMJU|nr:hypothetical protein CPB84DRAFT_1792725 [Gymnopilus junonius]